MTKKIHFLWVGLATISLVIVGCDKQTPTEVQPRHESPLGPEMAPGSIPGTSSLPVVQTAPAFSQVSYGSLTGTGSTNFNDVAGGSAPGTNYDGILESGGTDFAERFVGQTLSFSGNFDVLSGNPTGPLTLQVGAPNKNINVFTFPGSNVLTGLGPTGYPDFNSIGEGSFALLFDFDQSEVGIRIVGGNSGTATINFFKRDATLIQTIVVNTPGNTLHGFKRAGGTNDIAGFSVHNNDPGGIAYDDLKYDVPGVLGPPPSNQPPVADAGADQTVECASPAGASVTLNGTNSSDPDGDPLTFSWSAPGITFDDPSSDTPTATFPLGTTTVTLTVTDPSGLTNTDQVAVTVEDTTPPTVTVSATPSSLWPPKHKYRMISLPVSATDVCDASVSVSAVVVSSEPDDANGVGDGKTTGDIKVTTSGGTVLLSSNASPAVSFDPINDQLEVRAERNGRGPGRIYTITVTATDDSGNQATSTTTVVVSHDRGV